MKTLPSLLSEIFPNETMNYQPNNPWTNPSSPYAYAHGNAHGNAVMGTVQLLLAEPTQPTTRWTRVEENKLFLDLLYDNPEVDWKAISQQLPGHDADDCKMKRWTVIKRRYPDFGNNPALRPYDWNPREDDLPVDLYELGGDWDLTARQLRGPHKGGV